MRTASGTKEAAVGDQRETEPGQEEQDELDRQRKQGDRDPAEGENDGSGADEPGDKIRQAEPEEKAEKETTEDIDRAFD
jgi:hypothetical protein